MYSSYEAAGKPRYPAALPHLCHSYGPSIPRQRCMKGVTKHLSHSYASPILGQRQVKCGGSMEQGSYDLAIPWRCPHLPGHRRPYLGKGVGYVGESCKTGVTKTPISDIHHIDVEKIREYHREPFLQCAKPSKKPSKKAHRLPHKIPKKTKLDLHSKIM